MKKKGQQSQALDYFHSANKSVYNYGVSRKYLEELEQDRNKK